VSLLTRYFAGSSVPAAVTGRRRQRVSDGLVRQLLAVGPRRLPRPRGNVRRSQHRVDVRAFVRLPARLRRSDGDDLADGSGGGEQVSSGVLALQVRRLLLTRGH